MSPSPGVRRLAAGLAVGLALAGCAAGEPGAGGGTTAASTAAPGCPEPAVPEPSPDAQPGGPLLPPAGTASAPAAYAVEVVDRLPHDEEAFTQGLLHDAGRLLEGTGGFGTSDVRAVEPDTGATQARQELPPEVFGEGLALHDGRLYQLTWTQEVGYVRDRCTLEQTGDLAYEGEGWGLASDGEVLWRSDGSQVLRAHDPQTFQVLETLEVTDRGTAVDRLNELEVVDGDLLANVWQTDQVARIDLDSGAVVGWIDGGPLVEEVTPVVGDDPDAVLNGIAADPGTGRLWLTGKLWPTVFEVRLVEGGELPAPGAP